MMPPSEETYRCRLDARDLKGQPCSLIVRAVGLGSESRIQLSFHGASATTAVMPPQTVMMLGEALREAAA